MRYIGGDIESLDSRNTPIGTIEILKRKTGECMENTLEVLLD